MEVVIVEDEVLASDKLEMMLLAIDPVLKIKAVLRSVEEATDWFMMNQCDLIFLDINLSDDLSFKIFQKVKVDTPIIFTTAYGEYALKAFEQNSLAYLLKPIDKEELRNSINKYHRLKNADIEKIKKVMSHLVLGTEGPSFSHSKRTRFTVTYGGKMRSIAVKDIALFLVKDKAVYMVTFAGQKYLMDETMEVVASQLSDNFFRVNRQYIVCLEAIESIIPYSTRKLKIEVQVDVSESIVVPADKVKSFKEWFKGSI
ncbi:LytR/AlgR family response regulator transcription factor [Reichenbachiella versicolor]|uniref:LytR/AlgR family response regulator transcription factor n=1 Tax=Reichenbachiella versicolor TaxID=1821036 RepID=UPI000D6E967C|nr:LytTR family DNA-binding domain-containing protein [Reichenbachiella versicolor]